MFIWSIFKNRLTNQAALKKRHDQYQICTFSESLPYPVEPTLSCNLRSPASKLLADQRGATTAQRRGVRRRPGGAAAWCHASASCDCTEKYETKSDDNSGFGYTAHPLSLSGKGPVIFKSSSTFPKLLWTRHHSFAIRSLDATGCNYDCNPRHPCKLNAPDSKTMGSSKKYSLCIAFQWHNSSHCPSNKTPPQ